MRRSAARSGRSDRVHLAGHDGACWTLPRIALDQTLFDGYAYWREDDQIRSGPIADLGKQYAPPQMREAPKPDLKVEPKPRKAAGTAEPRKEEQKVKKAMEAVAAQGKVKK